jgi:hypothetical protein
LAAAAVEGLLDVAVGEGAGAFVARCGGECGGGRELRTGEVVERQQLKRLERAGGVVGLCRCSLDRLRIRRRAVAVGERGHRGMASNPQVFEAHRGAGGERATARSPSWWNTNAPWRCSSEIGSANCPVPQPRSTTHLRASGRGTPPGRPPRSPDIPDETAHTVRPPRRQSPALTSRQVSPRCCRGQRAARRASADRCDKTSTTTPAWLRPSRQALRSRSEGTTCERVARPGADDCNRRPERTRVSRRLWLLLVQAGTSGSRPLPGPNAHLACPPAGSRGGAPLLWERSSGETSTR